MGRQDYSLSRDVTSSDILLTILSTIHDKKKLGGKESIFKNKTVLGIK